MASKREQALAAARVAGYHDDGKTWCRVFAESRVSAVAMKAAWVDGKRAKQNGVRCDCYECRRVAR